MTNEEVLKVLEKEKECIQRQINGDCDNKRDCANCDLRLEDKEIILAYNTAISALEKQIPKKPIITIDGFLMVSQYMILGVAQIVEKLMKQILKIMNIALFADRL